MVPLIAAGEANGNGHVREDEAWPEMDLPTDRLARIMDDPIPEPVRAEPPSLEPATTALIPFVAAEAVAEATADASDADEIAPDAELVAPVALAAADGDGVAPEIEVAADADAHLQGMAPGQSLDDAIAAWEAQLAAEEAGQDAEAMAAAEAAEETVPAVIEPAWSSLRRWPPRSSPSRWRSRLSPLPRRSGPSPSRSLLNPWPRWSSLSPWPLPSPSPTRPSPSPSWPSRSRSTSRSR